MRRLRINRWDGDSKRFLACPEETLRGTGGYRRVKMRQQLAYCALRSGLTDETVGIPRFDLPFRSTSGFLPVMAKDAIACILTIYEIFGAARTSPAQVVPARIATVVAAIQNSMQPRTQATH